MSGLKSFWKYTVIAAVLFLFGCAGGKAVKTYPGDKLPDDVVALLEVPETINVLSVNGKRTTRYLLEDLAVTYALKPGENKVELEYATLWASRSNDPDGARATAVKSKRKTVIFVAESGQTYQLDSASAGSLEEAERVAAAYEPNLTTLSGSKVPLLAQLTQEAAAAIPTTGQAPRLVSVPEISADTSTQLRLYWDRASAEEKQQFLKWALQ